MQTNLACCETTEGPIDYDGEFHGEGTICCGNGQCCPPDKPICCDNGLCCEETQGCCGTRCYDLATQRCCDPGGSAAIAAAGPPEVCEIDGKCCLNVCCADGLECCGQLECCDPLLCNACVDHGSLSGGTITVNPPVVCVGGTLSFTVSGVVDSGGSKRAPCLTIQPIPGVTPTYTWELTKPDGTGVSGSGATASVTADIPGMYSCKFEAVVNRLCAPPSPPEYIVGPMAGTAVELKSETSATIPPDRTRRTIGVCEQVAVTTNPVTSATWSLSGVGSLSPSFGGGTTLTAADTVGTSSVTATFTEGASCEIQFSVVAPSAPVMAVITGSKMHTTGTASAGFAATIAIIPQTVSFGRAEIQEQTANAVTTGYFNVLSGLLHPQGSWHGVEQDNLVNAQDLVTSGTLPPPFAEGTFVWSIPYNYRCVGSAAAGIQFCVVDQIASVTSDGIMTVSKAGASVTCQPSDPTSP